MPSFHKFGGPGIAAAGFLTVAASAVLMALSLQVGQFAELPRWVYRTPILIGYLGVLVGFLTCFGGIVISWAGFGYNEISIDWLFPIAVRIQRWSSAVFFKLGALCAAPTVILSMASSLGYDASLQAAGFFGLAAATFTYGGALKMLWKFIATKLFAGR